MIERVVAFSLAHRLLVAFAVAVLVVLGIRAYVDLPVDAVPDITNVQVQVLTNAPGLAPLEVEQLVTRPVELAMAGLPGVTQVRSTSRTSVSAVTIVFTDDTDLAYARSLVSQRLPAAREAIPPSANRPDLGPLTTGLGEVVHFTIEWPGHEPRELRTVFDWEIARALRQVPGVVEVNAWGAGARQIEVRLRPADMQAHGVTQHDVEEALLSAGQSGGGGALDRGQDQVLVRFDGQFRSVDEVGRQVVAARGAGTSVLVRDVATVRDGEGFRASAATSDGRGETLNAMAQMVAGGNAHTIVPLVEARLRELGERLPKGVVIRPFYVRTHLVDRVLATVGRSLVEGGLVVVVVLFAFFGDVRSALVVATTIPLAMLGAFFGMRAIGATGNLMSLGAVDFGLVVDGAVVVVEGMLAAMALRSISAKDALVREGREVGGSLAFGVVIIGIVYVPVLLLEGVEGKMFRPMALTVLFALATAFVLTFTWVPVLASVLVTKAHAEDGVVVRLAKRALLPVSSWLLARPWAAAGVFVSMLALGLTASVGRGAEFVPRLEEGDLVVQLTRPASISLRESIAGTSAVEKALVKFPEVVRVVSRSGSPDVATDIMGIEQSDVFVILKPPAEWKTARTREGLVTAMEDALREAQPGTLFNFTQPIEMRSQELLGGIKADVGVKVFGEDIGELTRLANAIASAIESVPGAADVRVEATTGLEMISARPDSEGLSRHGAKADDVRVMLEAMRAGRQAGVLVEGEKRFDVVVRLDGPPPPNVAAFLDVPVPVSGKRVVPLGELAHVRTEEGPAQLSREGARRRVLVEANVRGRDLASFVGDIQKKLSAIERPPGYYVELAGQYENLVRAEKRLAVVVPLTLVAIFALLWLAFREALPSVLVFANVPAAASGGIVGLALRGMPFSISAAVGFIALFGVATMNGVVLLGAVRRLEREGHSAREAARLGVEERIRPVLTTAVVASLGFLPMALATGTGAEVQRPLATVVTFGLVTATCVTLGVLPAAYAALARKKPDGAAPASVV